MKSIQIYKTRKNYKILTAFRTESWTYIIGKPIFLLPFDVSIEEFSFAVCSALEISSSISEIEEEKIRSSHNEMLKDLSEKSMNELYKNSKSCFVYYDDEVISIIPNIFINKNEGLIEDVSNTKRICFSEKNYNELSKYIINILE